METYKALGVICEDKSILKEAYKDELVLLQRQITERLRHIVEQTYSIKEYDMRKLCVLQMQLDKMIEDIFDEHFGRLGK